MAKDIRKPGTGAKQNKSEKGPLATVKKVGGFSQQIIGTLIIFLCLSWGYSLFTSGKETSTVPLSEFSSLVASQNIVSIVVQGDTLTGTKKDGTVVTSKKETGASAVTTLQGYGVSTSTLSATTVTIKNDRGLSFWGSLVPILLPILF
mgnify:FL=1